MRNIYTIKSPIIEPVPDPLDSKFHELEVTELEKGFGASFTYPNSTEIPFLEINLEHVRATDGIRVWYNFDRNGWVIEQASTFSWEEGETEFDMDWQEVAFVESWAREKREDDDVVL